MLIKLTKVSNNTPCIINTDMILFIEKFDDVTFIHYPNKELKVKETFEEIEAIINGEHIEPEIELPPLNMDDFKCPN